MTRGRILRLSLSGIAATVVLVLVGAVVLGVVLVRRPFPDYGGSVTLPGLNAKVTVLRDARGVAQIYADSADDLFRAQGYAHAQDRFFEMDLRRHIAAGRLSELVGADKDALLADKAIRTMGWRRVAEQEVAEADPRTRGYLDAYAAGVNDYLRTRSRNAAGVSVNYTILGLANPLEPIEPWTPVDSMSWLKAMAWDLRSNYFDELARARAFGSVPDVGRVAQLFPPYPADVHAPILSPQDVRTQASALPAGTAARPGTARSSRAEPGAGVAAVLGGDEMQAALEAAQRAVDAVPVLLGRGGEIGSNSWVVSGDLTSTGTPMLANDPHLDTSIPGVWQQMGLHCRTRGSTCPFDVAGFTFSGVPGVLIGHTDRFAWGLTTMYVDATDFYLERLEGDSALVDGKPEPLATRTEQIMVAGGDPVTITVRATRHGPLLSDVLPGVAEIGTSAPVPDGSPARSGAYGVSLAWTALKPGHAMDALLGIDAARDFDSFRGAARLLDAPGQSAVYADVDGHIGFVAASAVPNRAVVPARDGIPADGTWPMPGWESAYDWKGLVPADRLPSALDPPEGFIVAANQAVTGPGGPVRLGTDTDYGYRSQRLRDLIVQAREQSRPLRLADMTAMQLDTRNGIAKDLVPLLLSIKVDSFTAQAQDLLRGWQGYTQEPDSAAAAYFNAVWATLLDLTFSDELPVGARADGGDRWFEVVRTLLAKPQDPWWDDRSTPDVVESRDQVMRQAMEDARLQLTSALGKDPQDWQWGRLHQVELRQTPVGISGQASVLHWLVNRGPFDIGGGSATVDAMAWDAAEGTFDVTAGPSMRMVVDLGDLDRSVWVNQTGNSAHPGHPHYDDQVSAWVEGRTFPWPFTEKAVRDASTDELTLVPPAPG